MNFSSTHVKHVCILLSIGIPLIGGLFQILILPFCPESPSWLYLTRGSHDLSKKALAGFGGAFNIPKQLNAYESEAKEESSRVKVRALGLQVAHSCF